MINTYLVVMQNPVIHVLLSVFVELLLLTKLSDFRHCYVSAPKMMRGVDTYS